MTITKSKVFQEKANLPRGSILDHVWNKLVMRMTELFQIAVQRSVVKNEIIAVMPWTFNKNSFQKRIKGSETFTFGSLRYDDLSSRVGTLDSRIRSRNTAFGKPHAHKRAEIISTAMKLS
jgi:hypothetical protein